MRVLRWIFSSYPGQFFLDLCAWFCERCLVPVVCLFTTPGELFARPLAGAVAYVLLGAAFTFGNVLLTSSSLPSTSQNTSTDTLLLGGPSWRVASRIIVRSRQGRRIVVVNTHFHNGDSDPARAIRQEQAQLLVAWVNAYCDELTEGQGHEMPCVILGDFNGRPEENCFANFRAAGFKSAHMEAHGREPSETFHQHHECLGKDVDIAGVLDYIWIRGPICASSVELVGNSAKAGDPTLWPSDHYGIVADLAFL